MSEPTWAVSDDKTKMTLTIPTNPPTVFQLDAAGVDRLLETIGAARYAMSPPYEPKWASGQVMRAVPNPAWTSEPDALLGNSLLHIRDPRYGWLHYLVPKQEAQKMGESLMRQAAASPPLSGGTRPN